MTPPRFGTLAAVALLIAVATASGGKYPVPAQAVQAGAPMYSCGPPAMFLLQAVKLSRKPGWPMLQLPGTFKSQNT